MANQGRNKLYRDAAGARMSKSSLQNPANGGSRLPVQLGENGGRTDIPLQKKAKGENGITGVDINQAPPLIPRPRMPQNPMMQMPNPMIGGPGGMLPQVTGYPAPMFQGQGGGAMGGVNPVPMFQGMQPPTMPSPMMRQPLPMPNPMMRQPMPVMPRPVQPMGFPQPAVTGGGGMPGGGFQPMQRMEPMQPYPLPKMNPYQR